MVVHIEKIFSNICVGRGESQSTQVYVDREGKTLVLKNVDGVVILGHAASIKGRSKKVKTDLWGV